ncbi:MAG TPA: hypothetical protein H9743_14285 [Candidatus Mediterraneibacter vanvlietii]|nr:hypothetical protein [Candidatus Mediterraneibacter vanvlietii]
MAQYAKIMELMRLRNKKLRNGGMRLEGYFPWFLQKRAEAKKVAENEN